MPVPLLMPVFVYVLRESRAAVSLVRGVALLAAVAALSLPAWAEDDPFPIDKQMQAKRRPKVYLTVFNNGYSGDPMPQDPRQFEKLLQVITQEGNFNTVMCRYSPEREALCRKYEVLMLVDLLASGHHVFQNPKECEALCNKLRGNPIVVAYHLWADRFGSTGPGRVRDINNVHQWDPTHATYIGTYQNGGIGYLAKSDFVSYYDFSWKRGPQKNFPNLLAAWNAAKIHDNRLGRYVETDGGLAGKGNYNRSLFTQNTSIACGLRGCLWFIGSRIMNMGSIQFNQLGKDAARVNAWVKPMWREIPKLGLPYAIYATGVTRDFNNNPVAAPADGKPAMAPGLEKHAVPADFWLQPVSGEFVMGVSKYDCTDKDAVYVANLNAYAEQNVTISVNRSVRPKMFNRQTGRYEGPQGEGAVISFKLEPAGGAILLFE